MAVGGKFVDGAITSAFAYLYNDHELLAGSLCRYGNGCATYDPPPNAYSVVNERGSYIDAGGLGTHHTYIMMSLPPWGVALYWESGPQEKQEFSLIRPGAWHLKLECLRILA